MHNSWHHVVSQLRFIVLAALGKSNILPMQINMHAYLQLWILTLTIPAFYGWAKGIWIPEEGQLCSESSYLIKLKRLKTRTSIFLFFSSF